MKKKNFRPLVHEKNASALPISPLDVIIIERSQRRVLRAYRRIGKAGVMNLKAGKIVKGWRAIQYSLDLSNVRIAWKFVYENVIPSDPAVRYQLGIPRVLPSERKPRKEKRVVPPIGVGEWQPFYFKAPKPRKWKIK